MLRIKFGILLLLVSSTVFGQVTIKGGRFYISIGEVVQEKWYGTRHTADAAAINAAFDCVCTVVIKQPDITIMVSIDQEEEEVIDPVVIGSATVSWSPPTQREDGAGISIDEISHYLVAYQYKDETKIRRVNYGYTKSFVFPDLGEGTHSFKVAAVDKDGLISDYSETASKTIQ